MPLSRETLFVGEFPAGPIDPSTIVQVTCRKQAETVPNGTLIQRWDYLTLCTPSVPRPSALLPLRQQSDDLADAVVDYLNLKHGQDALAAIEAELAKSEPESCVRDLWADVNRDPPAGVSAYVHKDGGVEKSESSRGRPEEAMSRNDRFGEGGRREPSLEEGQAVFWRYSGGIFTALMHFSLAGGFSSPNLSAVMRSTGYLTSSSRDATYRRLVETTLFVLDAMSDMRVGEGKGWKSAVRVRLLHAMVRRKIKQGKGRIEYSYEEAGVPINQVDLATVLGSFMIAPLWSLRRSGIHLTPFEQASYQAAWRHVGFYLGVSPSLLLQFYGRSYAHAESSFASLAFEAFPTEIPPISSAYSTPTYQILSAVANRPPRGQPVGHHLEMSRHLLGTGLANQLALPRGSWKERMTVELELWLGWMFVHFGRAYRRGWEMERQGWFREVIPLLVLYNLGERRSTFAWRNEERREEKLGHDEGEEPGVKMGKSVGQEVRRRWYWLIGEMVAVLGFGAVGGALAVGWAGHTAYKALA